MCRKLILFLLLLPLFTGCARHVRYDYSVCHPPVKRSEVIVIDAGHGGKDPGSESVAYGYEEKVFTLRTAHLLSDYLRDLGYQVVMTRDEDRFIPLKERAEIANQQQADLFVSVHYNHSSKETVDGVEVFYYDGEQTRQEASHKLGKLVLTKVLHHTQASSRGVKVGNYAVIRETTMPAILVEGGFLSNPEERKKLKDPKYLHFVAYGIARGIDAYFAN